jgi:hypothetical protein
VGAQRKAWNAPKFGRKCNKLSSNPKCMMPN